MTDLTAAFRHVLSNFTNFSDRASRPEYWWWILAYFLLMLVIGLIDALVIVPLLGAEEGQPLSTVVALVMFLPALAVAIRRLHDIDRTGWWMLIVLVPILGFLVLLYFFVQPGTPGPNRFGPPAPWERIRG